MENSWLGGVTIVKLCEVKVCDGWEEVGECGHVIPLYWRTTCQFIKVLAPAYL